MSERIECKHCHGRSYCVSSCCSSDGYCEIKKKHLISKDACLVCKGIGWVSPTVVHSTQTFIGSVISDNDVDNIKAYSEHLKSIVESQRELIGLKVVDRKIEAEDKEND